MKQPIYTIGHSTRSIEEFIVLLSQFKIKQLVDVRTIAGSRFNPQFNGENLKNSLHKSEIEYIHLTELGGLRHTTKESINTAWKNKSFRGYADYMQTPEFADGIKRLMDIAAEKSTVIMCAEAVPWRCHRSLIGDALNVRGIEVKDIISEKSCKTHKLTSFAVVKDLSITYPLDEIR